MVALTNHLWFNLEMEKINILKFVLARLDEVGQDAWEEIAEKSGVPYDTLIKVGKRITKNPRVETAQLLYNYLVGQKAKAAA